MTDLEQLIETVDSLPPSEWQALYRHMTERKREGVWYVPGENLAALKEILAPLHAQTEQMTEEEVFAVIDETIAEVRREAAQRRD